MNKKLMIKPQIVESSSYTRQLELADRLAEFLKQVEGFKAMKKLEVLFYSPVPEGASRYYNKHNLELAKTEFGFYIHERYGRLSFAFYRTDTHPRFSLEFDITDKSIPAIIAGLAVYRSSLAEWKAVENESAAYEVGVCREIENQFNQGELTRTQFENKRVAVAAMLRELANEVEATTAE